MPVVDITPKFIKTGLICPPGKRRVEYCDRNLKGFFIEVTDKSPGKGTYRLRHTINGKNQTIPLGHTYDTDIKAAKQKARELKAQYALQKNPYMEIQDQKTIPTWSSFFEKVYLPYAKSRKRTFGKDETMYRLRLKKALGDKQLNQIDRQTINAIHSDLVNKDGLSPATADRYLSHMKAVLSQAVKNGIIRDNVAKGVSLFNIDNSVENYLDSEQLKRLIQSLHDDENAVVKDLVLLLLNSGARLMEGQLMMKKHVSIETKIWTVPATNSKSRKVRKIPLNEMAIEIIERNISDNGYVFVNPRTGTAYNNIHKSWNRIRNRAGLPHLRLHDLRHSFSKMLLSDGNRSLFELQRILGHSSPFMTQRYAHLSNKTLLEASNSASDTIRKAMKMVSGGN